MTAIVFNGKTYNSIEEMPANERQAFEHLSAVFVDKNGNGIPDFLEGDMVKNIMTAYTTSMNINGQMVGNVQQLTPEMQAKLQAALQKMSQLGIAPIPPMQAGTSQPVSPQVPQSPSFTSTEPSFSRDYSPAIQEEQGSNPLVWWLLAGGLLLICALAAALGILLYLRGAA